MTIDEIKNNLRTGDYIRIALYMGYKGDKKVRQGSQYVCKVLNSSKTSFKGKAKLIIEKAEDIALKNIKEVEHQVPEPSEM